MMKAEETKSLRRLRFCSSVPFCVCPSDCDCEGSSPSSQKGFDPARHRVDRDREEEEGDDEGEAEEGPGNIEEERRRM